ncbi:hypothetical protein FQN57_006751 [Myotisia sp. PD_48]|nr:hypothetical protein FQN57_006751 [Myotisia sp. PD_48]
MGDSAGKRKADDAGSRHQKRQKEIPDSNGKDEDSNAEGDDVGDIEQQIQREVERMKPQRSNAPFQVKNLDIPCLVFVKLDKALDPVEIVHQLCADAQKNPERKRTRWVKRLTPITSMRKILGGGLEELAREVLGPHFHSGGLPKRFAVRATIRNNTEWHKETVNKTVAGVVGPEHPVDLKNYDTLILVDIFQNICGMSVVKGDYDQLKRYNLSELYDPTPLPETKQQEQGS